jgi:hypothetical protein
MGDPAAGVSALSWSVTAMNETVERLTQMGEPDRVQLLAVTGEAVWWVTIVDATLVRYHLRVYDHVMTGLGPVERRLVEGMLSGLRFVRNQLGHKVELAEFVEPSAGVSPGWRWRPVPQPRAAPFAQRSQVWEMRRYRDYAAHLAGEGVGDVFGRVAGFLQLTAAEALSLADASWHAAR